MTVRTRFEPAPTGSLHVGHALAASFNWYWARKHGGAFVLRIADTDRERVVSGGAEAALEDLKWLGLTWDEGPYHQSERIERYREAAERLLDEGKAYRCYCSPEELDARRKEALAAGRPPGYDARCRRLTEEQVRAFEDEGRVPVVRFKMPEGETHVTDLVRGASVFQHQSSDDVVLVRADGWPLYNLAAPYDDMAMGITHVLRGEDIFPNTARQVRLIEALGGEPPAYGHFPLLVGPGGQKLSKRHGATAVGEYREMGFLPEVLLNYLAILDWSIGDGVTERFTIEELIHAFDPSGVTRNPSAFDIQKLTAFNGEAIRALPVEAFVDRIVPFLERDGIDADRGVLLRIAPLVQERMHRLDEAPAQLRFLFEDPTPDERARALLERETSATYLARAADVLDGLDVWTHDRIADALQAWADGAGIKRKDAFQPVRAAVTGSLVSPPLFESMEILGRDRTLARVRGARAAVSG